MSVLQSLKSDVLPRLVGNGTFGTDKVRLIEYENDESTSAGIQYQSSVYFGNVVMETKNGDTSTQSVMIKTLPERLSETVAWSLERHTDLQFQNELLFYSEILPLLRKCDRDGEVTRIFPKFFHGSIKPGGSSVDNIIIIENVQKLGFKHADAKVFVDYEHIKLTLEWTARFHALSYVCKKRFPREFQELGGRIQEMLWTRRRVLERWDKFYVEQGKRGILPLQNDPNYRDRLEGISTAIQEADLSMAKIVTPAEPLAVICHGDLGCNNIFYRYDSSGSPSAVIFFDFGMIRHASPVIDLSFFLLVHASPDLRSQFWEDMLSIYHSALRSNPDLGPRDFPSLEEVTVDFQRRGLYGYVHAAYWLPILLQEEELEKWWTFTVEELIELRLRWGGERATRYVVEIVKHMIDKQFDFSFINSIQYE
ncbi:unnamed protein product [Bemisia tabaci]|uniref:CHK kinase-like domain-containing protein n=1 Tax=Bemisia tabaci TaxID=7038 RepID=A0A9P0F2J6_BEMTA|nr:unnamed protein product [Bemisia tabaci]